MRKLSGAEQFAVIGALHYVRTAFALIAVFTLGRLTRRPSRETLNPAHLA